MRVCLLTDTLGDVNGVSRCILAMAEHAQPLGRDLRAACSTRFEVPARPNLVNFPPRAAARMPRYEHLEIAWPPARAMLAWARAANPDVVHVSTPGPVGLVGRRAARLMGVPLLGVYHTDFPAYVGHLLDDAVCARAAAGYMRWFYAPFTRVLTRTKDYEVPVERLGIVRSRITTLRAGIDAQAFSPAHRDPAIWTRLSVPAGPKVMYVGRVSVEKGLPLLARAWHELEQTSDPSAPNTPADPPVLVIVGDGPYRAAMEHELRGRNTRFLGFRHGPELSALYASADLFVFPSTTDTLGQSVMEAQASGLPALVTGVGGPAGIVRDGRTGLILPADRPGPWAAAIRSLIADPSARERMGREAHALMRDASIAGSFEHFWSLHEQAVSARPA